MNVVSLLFSRIFLDNTLFFPPSNVLKDEIVADIEARIAAWTFLPVGNFLYAFCCFSLTCTCYTCLFHLSLTYFCDQKMVNLSKYCTMRMVRSMSPILIIFMTRLIKSWVATGLQLS